MIGAIIEETNSSKKAKRALYPEREIILSLKKIDGKVSHIRDTIIEEATRY